MKRRTALWVACVAQLLVVLDVSVMNVALPTIRDDLELGATATSWVVLGYGVAFAGALLAAARLADRFGASQVLIGSTAVFTVASVVGGLAPDGSVLVGARVVQGLAAAAISPATFTLLTLTFTEGSSRTRAVAIWTAVSVAGGGVGNVLSGALTELVSWRAVLLINLPIGLAIIVVATSLARRDRPSPGISIAWGSSLVSVGAFASAALGLTLLGDSGPATATGALALVASTGFLALLAHLERRNDAALVPRGLWRRATIVRGTLATLLTAMCFQVAIWFFLAFRLHDQLAYTPLETGLAFLPLTCAVLVVNLLAVPPLLDRLDPWPLIAAGALIAATGALWFAGVDTTGPWIAVIVPSLLVGIGGGLMNTPLATLITAGVISDEAGATSGLMNTAKQFGGAIGLAMATGAASMTDSSRAPFAVMAVALVLAALVTHRTASPPRPTLEA